MKEERLYKLAHEALSNKWGREYDFLKEHPENETSQIRERELWSELIELKEKMKEWDESEYIEKPVISEKDRAILDYIIGEFKYIARDSDGRLFFYEKEPYKNSNKSWVHIGVNCFCLNRRICVDFPMVKWEDEEPWFIEDLKKLEVVKEYEQLSK